MIFKCRLQESQTSRSATSAYVTVVDEEVFSLMGYETNLCGRCDGTGYIEHDVHFGDNSANGQIVEDVCPACDGEGLSQMGSHK